MCYYTKHCQITVESFGHSPQLTKQNTNYQLMFNLVTGNLSIDSQCLQEMQRIADKGIRKRNATYTVDIIIGSNVGGAIQLYRSVRPPVKTNAQCVEQIL